MCYFFVPEYMYTPHDWISRESCGILKFLNGRLSLEKKQNENSKYLETLGEK